MLFLSDTRVSNAGLVHLEALNKLRDITLTNTRVNEEGLKRLHRALPGLGWVDSDQPPFDYAGAEAANQILEKVKAGDLPGFSAIVEKNPAAVNFHSTGFYKNDDDHRMTALHFATRRGDLPMVKFLLAHGANVKTGNDCGDTPLHFALTVEIATALIAAGADVRAKGNCGNSPLHDARTKRAAASSAGSMKGFACWPKWAKRIPAAACGNTSKQSWRTSRPVARPKPFLRHPTIARRSGTGYPVQPAHKGSSWPGRRECPSHGPFCRHRRPHPCP